MSAGSLATVVIVAAVNPGLNCETSSEWESKLAGPTVTCVKSRPKFSTRRHVVLRKEGKDSRDQGGVRCTDKAVCYRHALFDRDVSVPKYL